MLSFYRRHVRPYLDMCACVFAVNSESSDVTPSNEDEEESIKAEHHENYVVDLKVTCSSRNLIEMLTSGFNLTRPGTAASVLKNLIFLK